MKELAGICTTSLKSLFKVFEWWFKFSIWRCVTWFLTTRYFQGISSVRVTPKHDVLGFFLCVCVAGTGKSFVPGYLILQQYSRKWWWLETKILRYILGKKSLVKCSFCPHKYLFLHCCVFQPISGNLYTPVPEPTENITLVSGNMVPQENP